jgi:Zn-dependent M28 family amino/carboxypeptidase
VGAQARISEAAIRAHMELLAGDALNGRGSGTRDEWIAATYIAAQLRQSGVVSLSGSDGFIEQIDIPARPPASASTMTVGEVPGQAGGGQPGRRTWNVTGQIPGASGAQQVILLSAHIDHLGVRGDGPDRIYNGADDDASGVAMVLELARALAQGPPSRRTIMFAFFGSEETGGMGSRHFVDNPPVPLPNILMNLQFEMVGRPDNSLPRDTFWLAGFDRSTLGEELARRGARVVADPHVEQGFFLRSDNIRLASRGVVAHSVSSYGLHTDYHTPADDLSRIDYPHMTRVATSLLAAIEWLADSTFAPAWKPGLSPERSSQNGQ